MTDNVTRLPQPRNENLQASRAAFPVRLGQREFALTPKTIRQSKEWKASLSETLSSLGSFMNAEVADMAAVMTEVSRLIGGADDIMLDLLGQYSPEIAEAREGIEETATSGEAYDALMEVIRVEFPFLRGLGDLSGAQRDAT